MSASGGAAARPRYRALIVDDEPPARSTLRILLGQYPEIDVVGECGDAAAALEHIRLLAPDVMFVDVQMPGATGLDVVHDAGLDTVPVVVFTTAFAEYALQAFEVHALDYLLKPFSDERFAAVMTRVLRALSHARPATLAGIPGIESRSQLTEIGHAQATGLVEAPPTGPIDSRSQLVQRGVLTIREAGRTHVMPIAEIDWIEAEDYCARIHAGARSVLIRRSLQSLQAALDPHGFVRVHRSAVVNRSRVREVRSLPSGDADVVLATGAVVRASRARLETVRF